MMVHEMTAHFKSSHQKPDPSNHEIKIINTLSLAYFFSADRIFATALHKMACNSPLPERANAISV